MGNLQIDNPRLAAEWHPTKNGDLIPSSITVGSVKKVWWRCSKGHEWQASPNNRSKGQGCPYCAGRRVLAGFNDLATTNPELAAEWHPTKNGENTPTCVTKGSGKKVWWLCSRGHVWQATIANRSKGRGCPQCHKIEKGSIRERAAIEKNGSFASECPELLQDWDAEKNEVDPKEISKNSTRKVWWKCHHCGYSWRSAVEKRSRANHGCPACVGKAVQPGFNDLATVRPDVAEYWNSSMNGSLTPQSVTAGSNKMVWWICNEGHAYQTTVSAKSNGAGCPFCANQRVLNGFNDLATTNPELAMEWHPTKNGGLKPKDITAGSSRLKVWWQCPVGHSYQATAASRRNGAGCPECDKESKTSFPEQALLYYLGQLTTAESRHQYAGKTEVDIYLPEINAAVEYDGHYWHSRKAAKVSEMKKDRAMAEDGIRLVHVKEVKRGDAVPPSTANVIYCEYSSNGKFIEKMFNELAQLLGFAVEEISKADVDIARDRAKIYSQYIESIKASCLATIDPNLARQWNPEKNNELTPKMVSANSGKRVWWLCAKGHSWQAQLCGQQSNQDRARSSVPSPQPCTCP